MLRTLLHLYGDIGVELEIFGEPDGGKVTPAQFLDNYVSVKQNFAYMNGVVSPDLVVRHAFVLTRVLIVKIGIFNYIFEWFERWVTHLVSMRFIHAHTRRQIGLGVGFGLVCTLILLFLVLLFLFFLGFVHDHSFAIFSSSDSIFIIPRRRVE